MGASDPIDGVAQFAGLLSNASRTKMLLLLAERKQGMTTMDMCTTLGIQQPRVSSHLSILLARGVVSVETRGRHRVYSLASGGVASLIRELASLSSSGAWKVSPVPAQGRGEGKKDSGIRQCRSCYDHLAGVEGVGLLTKMLDLGWLGVGGREREGGRMTYRLTPRGAASLRRRGVDVEGAASSKRAFAYGCLDWTERKPHLGGSLGRAILDSMVAGGIVERSRGTRALKVARPIPTWMGPAGGPASTE